MATITRRATPADPPPFTTKDGSHIRELMHPTQHGNQAQSLAEATVDIGKETTLHRHAQTEELYHILEGHGLMFLDTESFAVAPGDTILIPPGTAHKIRALGAQPLRLLCCCAPAYSDQDTELLTTAERSTTN